MNQNTGWHGKPPWKPPNCSLCDDHGAVLCEGRDSHGLTVWYAYQCHCPKGYEKQPALPPYRVM